MPKKSSLKDSSKQKGVLNNPINDENFNPQYHSHVVNNRSLSTHEDIIAKASNTSNKKSKEFNNYAPSVS